MWYLPTEVKRSSNISSGQQARSETYKTREGRRYDVTLASHRSFFFYLLYVPSLRALPCQVEPNWSGVSEYTYGVHSCNVYKTLTCEPNICNPLPRRNERPFFIARQQNATALRSLSQPHPSPCLAHVLIGVECLSLHCTYVVHRCSMYKTLTYMNKTLPL